MQQYVELIGRTLAQSLQRLIIQGQKEMDLQDGQIKTQMGKLSTKCTIRLKTSLPEMREGEEYIIRVKRSMLYKN